MAYSLADARFLVDRAMGLLRRTLASLRTRGWRESLARAKAHLGRARPTAARGLYVPAPGPFAPFALPTSGHPRASVVIPVFDQFPHTLACLRAIAEHPPRTAFEVIVVDDGCSDETVAALPQVAGLRYHRRARNGGFIAACNDGAALAQGDLLVFLNNDTVPQPGWLDAMVDTFAAHPDAGLVGAQLLYPDGRLQEAGGVVFADGNAWNYGRFESPDDPRFGYLRDTDYASAAAIAIPRSLFESLGGFDARYAPAYYEDTDLAFAVRAAGRRVLYQPAARVVHDEGATAGTDPTRGIKASQERNKAIFRAKWAEELKAMADGGARPSPGRLHAAQRQVLVIDEWTPRADNDSASLRLVNLMKMLSDQGAHVVFLPANGKHCGAHTVALQRLGVEAWHAPYSSGISKWFAEHGERFDVALVCRHYVAREFLPLLRKHAPQARVVFDTVDLHYVREQRAAALAGDAALARQAATTRGLELEVIARSDMTLVVSQAERVLLSHDAPDAHVEVLSNLHEVAGPGLPYAERRDLVFVGGFRHPPNVDAIGWFVDEVFPLIRQDLPEVRFHCIGGNVPTAIRARGEIDGVVVHDHVPDIRPWMDGCRVAVAPLRYGAGVKGKVNLSMAHGQPVVATTCAVEGMHLRDGFDVLVADDAAAFARAVVRLHDDPDLWSSLSRHGLENVSRHFSMDAAQETVRQVFLQP
ncbi:glycosyltransferase [Luteimonas vadosa]|uniref:Glycosyltransferase n=1 Tax=Luteimonas vadosa TaxID=1165507 RepID=A0ABP9E7E6_9GAMM